MFHPRRRAKDIPDCEIVTARGAKDGSDATRLQGFKNGMTIRLVQDAGPAILRVLMTSVVIDARTDLQVS